MTRMKKGLFNRWLKALKSGSYTKACGTLRDKGRYCCLGVLIDIEAKRLHRRRDRAFENWAIPTGSLLNPSFLSSTGLSDSKQRVLASLNDKFPGDKYAGVIKFLENNKDKLCL